MGWIIAVVVVLVIVSSLRSRAKRARARSETPMGFAPRRSPTFKQMMAGTGGPNQAPVFHPGDSPTYKPGDSATYQPGASPIYQPGDVVAYVPAAPIGSRPVATPPDMGVQSDYEPAYDEMSAVATAWRDQTIADKDQRVASRTSSQQAPYQSSTALADTALNTTLVTPYQQPVLMSTLSTSLTSSLTDTPVATAAPSLFAGVQVIALPVEIREQVRARLRAGQEVDAVRLVCDSMNVGLLEATKTVRSLA